MKKIFATGVEIHQKRSKKLAEEGVIVPDQKFLVVRFLGEDLKMYSGVSKLSFLDNVDPVAALDTVAEDFPVDGKPLNMADYGGVFPRESRDPNRATNRLRGSYIMGPPKDLDPEIGFIDGTICGWGTAFERIGAQFFVVPYISVHTLEETHDGNLLPRCLHARISDRSDKDGLFTLDDWLFEDPNGEAGMIPEAFARLRDIYNFGSNVRARVELESPPYCVLQHVETALSSALFGLEVKADDNGGDQPPA